jgi:hypothetical protein
VGETDVAVIVSWNSAAKRGMRFGCLIKNHTWRLWCRRNRTATTSFITIYIEQSEPQHGGARWLSRRRKAETLRSRVVSCDAGRSYCAALAFRSGAVEDGNRVFYNVMVMYCAPRFEEAQDGEQDVPPLPRRISPSRRRSRSQRRGSEGSSKEWSDGCLEGCAYSEGAHQREFRDLEESPTGGILEEA